MKSRSSYLPLIPYLFPYGGTIALALLCTLGFTVFWPILAWLAGRMAEFIGRGDVGAIAQLGVLSAGIFLVRGVMQYGQDTLMAKAALGIALDVRNHTTRHLLQLDVGYFERARVGDLTYRLTEDVDRIGEAVHKFFHQFVPCILQLVAVLGYMVYLNWQLTSASLVLAPLMALVIGYFGDRLLEYSRRSQHQVSNLSALLAEVFSGIATVQAFAAEGYLGQQLGGVARQSRNAKYLAERIRAFQFVTVGFLEAMSVIALFLLGGWQISLGNLTGSAFVSYVAGVALLIDPIAIATSNYNEFKQGEASATRIFELLALVPAVVESPHARPLLPVMGKVEYRDVTFAYPSPASDSTLASDPVLHRVNLLVFPGEAIALVGASGAGKSTLLKLLSRFYDPLSGAIYIDGTNIREVTLASLRGQIGIVPQETVLFSGTVAENIAFGKQECTLAEIEAAATIANAHTFITQLPQGYSTFLGERGVNLSGGQRQRLAIARAVLLDPKILLLDEATSALDSESEALVQEALERLMCDRTVFIIAHRLATVRRADRILVIEEGRIVESGTHTELLEQESRYAQFYAQQFQ